jgi:hypothetical protein
VEGEVISGHRLRGFETEIGARFRRRTGGAPYCIISLRPIDVSTLHERYTYIHVTMQVNCLWLQMTCKTRRAEDGSCHTIVMPGVPRGTCPLFTIM